VKKRIINIILAALAAGVGAAAVIITGAEDPLAAPVLTAAGYAALRAIVAFVSSFMGHPVPVDE